VCSRSDTRSSGSAALPDARLTRGAQRESAPEVERGGVDHNLSRFHLQSIMVNHGPSAHGRFPLHLCPHLPTWSKAHSDSWWPSAMTRTKLLSR